MQTVLHVRSLLTKHSTCCLESCYISNVSNVPSWPRSAHKWNTHNLQNHKLRFRNFWANCFRSVTVRGQPVGYCQCVVHWRVHSPFRNWWLINKILQFIIHQIMNLLPIIELAIPVTSSTTISPGVCKSESYSDWVAPNFLDHSHFQKSTLKSRLWISALAVNFEISAMNFHFEFNFELNLELHSDFF